jgi:outer membrane immunogenic protein
MFRTIIRTGLAIGVLLIAAANAQAADLRAPYKSPVYSAPSSYANWAGFYVGLNAGYGFGTSDWNVPTASTSPKGVLAGLTLGYNAQWGVWLFGLEGDLDYSGMKGSAACGAFTCDTKLPYFGTARARFGYTGWTNWLPYITAGAAFGDVKGTNSATGSGDKLKFGYAAGVGLEYALWSNWSVKGEYLYTDLGVAECGAACGTPTTRITFKASMVRFGVNYRF